MSQSAASESHVLLYQKSMYGCFPAWFGRRGSGVAIGVAKKKHWKILGDEKICSPRAIMIIMSTLW